MLIPVRFPHNTGYTRYTISNKLNFKGQLEDEFFSASKFRNVQGQMRCLNNIRFNIGETDFETGDNFLHAAIKSGNMQVINKALLLLGQKSNIDNNLVRNILTGENNEGKKPYEYTQNSDLVSSMSKLLGQEIAIEKPVQVPVETYKAINEIPDNEIKPLPETDDDDYYEIPTKPSISITPPPEIVEPEVGLKEIAGLTNAKQILLNRIVKPLENGQKVKDSGFLLYGPSGSGKGFLLKALAKTLNKKIISAKRLEQLVEGAIDQPDNEQVKGIQKQNEKIADILDKNIIRVEDVQQLESVIDFAKENYRNTNKQSVIYIDEIKGILPDVSAEVSNSVTKAEQLIEDSAAHGVILVATTREKDAIAADSIRQGRFDYKIELKFPSRSERQDLFEKNMTCKSFLNKEEMDSVLNKTSGFSYLNMKKLISGINELEAVDYKTLENEIKFYAKENNLGEINEAGTTANYDTKFKRVPIRKPANFNDVAGMKDVKYQFQKFLIDRLKPEQLKWFKEHNRPPVRNGFLLYGVAGTGKTYIVEALAGEMKIPLYKLSTANIKDKFVGESEKNIEAIFNQLETKFKETGEYSILFIDEANSLLGKREDANNSDSSLVDLFLQKINNSAERGVITIIATNFKDKIDNAILSRFGTKINIPLPDAEVRKAMIELEFSRDPELFKKITNDDINELTARLSGFSSRDISIILSNTIDACADTPEKLLDAEDFKREISNYALSHELPEINERNKTSAYDTYIKRLEITAEDPQTLDEIGGMKEIKEKLLQIVGFAANNPEKIERYRKNRVKEQNGILLYGEPGCGKTYIMKALAAHLNLPLYEFKLSQQGSSYIHATSNNLGKIFAQLKEKYDKTGEKSILLIDEFEDIASKRENNLHSTYKQEETDALLKEVQNAGKNGIIVVAATNFYNRIDDAMKRPGRFVSIHIPFPDFDSRVDIISKSLKDREIVSKDVFNKININKLAKASDGLSIADITETINLFIGYAISNDIDKLSTKDFVKSFRKMRQEKGLAKARGK